MRIDVMVDIETLGTNVNATIFQIAAVAFDLATGNIVAEFNQTADIAQNLNSLVVDGNTLKWWLNTNKDLLQKLLNSGEGSSNKLLISFSDWLNRISSQGEVHLWGNGILFDNAMIKTQLELIKQVYPIRFTNDRDVRTIVDLTAAKLKVSVNELKKGFNDDSLIAHDAFDDVKYQVRLVSGCYKILMN